MAEATERVRVLNRRSSSIALLAGIIIFSPFLLRVARGSFFSAFGCRLDSSLSSGCTIGDRDYAVLMYRLDPYANLSAQLYHYWLSLTLIWIAIALYEARRVNKIAAVIIGGAGIIVGVLNELLWNAFIRGPFDVSVLNLFQVPLRWALLMGVLVALAIFAVRNGFEVPRQDTRDGAS